MNVVRIALFIVVCCAIVTVIVDRLREEEYHAVKFRQEHEAIKRRFNAQQHIVKVSQAEAQLPHLLAEDCTLTVLGGENNSYTGCFQYLAHNQTVLCPTWENTPIVFSFGIGEDASFERALLEFSPCLRVYAFDPTPRAWEYWIAQPWVQKYSGEGRLIMLGVGLGINNELTTFLLPTNPAHVSVTYAHPGLPPDWVRELKPIHFSTMKLDTLMHVYGVRWLDLLKMDIEGAEFLVIDNVYDLNATQILLETHQRFFDDDSTVTIARLHARLWDFGFRRRWSGENNEHAYVRVK
jgi:FkbM family methyltransferase